MKKTRESRDLVYAVIGPTGSGKSDFAVKLAKKIGGEIVSADSRQIYQGLDLGTGKITASEMEGVQHYMLDIVDVKKIYSPSEYQTGALLSIDYIKQRNKIPIICGGTGQYIHSLLYTKKYPDVGPNPTLRKKLETKTVEELYELLKKKDKVRAKNIDKKNKVRLIRALEILEKLPSIPRQSKILSRFPSYIYLLDISKDKLKKRIITRLNKRMDAGLLSEVKELIKIVGKDADMKKYGIEYFWLTKLLAGECTEVEAKEKIISDSLKYAKRQITWNKKFFKNAEIVKIK